MSCGERSAASWRKLLAHRFSRSEAPPMEFTAALEHAATCNSCRRSALAVDPTLIFGRLVEPPRVAGSERATATLQRESSRDGWDSEAEAMREAVHNLLRVRQVASPVRPPTWAAVRRMALAAGLASVIAGGLAFRSLSPNVSEQPVGTVDTVAVGVTPIAIPAVFGAVPATEDWRLTPIVESIERSNARIYELDAASDGLSVTMIVDASFDV